jgi:hypothetical protein
VHLLVNAVRRLTQIAALEQLQRQQRRRRHEEAAEAGGGGGQAVAAVALYTTACAACCEAQGRRVDKTGGWCAGMRGGGGVDAARTLTRTALVRSTGQVSAPRTHCTHHSVPPPPPWYSATALPAGTVTAHPPHYAQPNAPPN